MTGIKWWYRVLYSGQLQKKSKSWIDGYMYYLVALKKAVLLDENGRLLDSYQPVNAGDLQGERELLMESFVVTVDGDPIDEPVFQQKAQAEPVALDKENIDAVPAPIGHAPACYHATLYTKDKQKKNKSWCDGHLSYDPAKKIAVFYDENRRQMHTKKCEKEDIADGSMFETGMHIIEVSNPIQKPDLKKKPADQEDVPVLTVDYDCDLDEVEPCFDLFYTADTRKKAKKWIDGYIQYHKATSIAKFYGEDGKMMFKRHLAWRQIDEQEELATARFIFQIGAHRDGPVESTVAAPVKPEKYNKRTSGKEEVELSSADLSLFMEHSINYTTDTQKKTKKWCDGHLWYETGLCKIFDEDGKEIYKKKMRPEEIVDGLEFKTWKHLVVVGAQVHKYHKDPVQVEEVPIVEPEVQKHADPISEVFLPEVKVPAARPETTAGRSASQLAALFGKKA